MIIPKQLHFIDTGGMPLVFKSRGILHCIEISVLYNMFHNVIFKHEHEKKSRLVALESKILLGPTNSLKGGELKGVEEAD